MLKMKLIDLIDLKYTQPNQTDIDLEEFGYKHNQIVYTDTKHIRDICDKTNMIATPIQFFDMENALLEGMAAGDNMPQIKESIQNFKNEFEQNSNLYVMCPIQFFDINRKIKASNSTDLETYSKKHADTLFTIDLIAPTIKAMQDNTDNLNKRVSVIETQSKILQERVRASQLRQINLEDPMLFAIPKSKKITDDCTAIIGTCWGKDIDNQIIENLELKNYNHNARNNIIEYYANKKQDLSSSLQYTNDNVPVLPLSNSAKRLLNTVDGNLTVIDWLYRNKYTSHNMSFEDYADNRYDAANTLLQELISNAYNQR